MDGNLVKSDCTLLSTSATHPPDASIVEPKYLNVLTHGIGTTAKQTSSLDPTGLKDSVFFLLIRSQFPSNTCSVHQVAPSSETKSALFITSPFYDYHTADRWRHPLSQMTAMAMACDWEKTRNYCQML